MINLLKYGNANMYVNENGDHILVSTIDNKVINTYPKETNIIFFQDLKYLVFINMSESNMIESGKCDIFNVENCNYLIKDGSTIPLDEGRIYKVKDSKTNNTFKVNLDEYTIGDKEQFLDMNIYRYLDRVSVEYASDRYANNDVKENYDRLEIDKEKQTVYGYKNNSVDILIPFDGYRYWFKKYHYNSNQIDNIELIGTKDAFIEGAHTCVEVAFFKIKKDNKYTVYRGIQPKDTELIQFTNEKYDDAFMLDSTILLINKNICTIIKKINVELELKGKNINVWPKEKYEVKLIQLYDSKDKYNSTDCHKIIVYKKDALTSKYGLIVFKNYGMQKVDNLDHIYGVNNNELIDLTKKSDINEIDHLLILEKDGHKRLMYKGEMIEGHESKKDTGNIVDLKILEDEVYCILKQKPLLDKTYNAYMIFSLSEVREKYKWFAYPMPNTTYKFFPSLIVANGKKKTIIYNYNAKAVMTFDEAVDVESISIDLDCKNSEYYSYKIKDNYYLHMGDSLSIIPSELVTNNNIEGPKVVLSNKKSRGIKNG